MTVSKALIAACIHLAVPVMGLSAYGLLVWRMRTAGIPRAPIVAFFILFATLGGWLLVVLTGLFWVWSGMATLGALYLIWSPPLSWAFSPSTSALASRCPPSIDTRL
jgi:hypothetical protein